MANYYPKTSHLKTSQWQPGQSGNPGGKPKGAKHLSTWIRELMEDEQFEGKLMDGTLIKGAPIKAIVNTLILKAIGGDEKAFDLLGKYGYGVIKESETNKHQCPTVTLVEFIGDDGDASLVMT